MKSARGGTKQTSCGDNYQRCLAMATATSVKNYRASLREEATARNAGAVEKALGDMLFLRVSDEVLRGNGGKWYQKIVKSDPDESLRLDMKYDVILCVGRELRACSCCQYCIANLYSHSRNTLQNYVKQVVARIRERMMNGEDAALLSEDIGSRTTLGNGRSIKLPSLWSAIELLESRDAPWTLEEAQRLCLPESDKAERWFNFMKGEEKFTEDQPRGDRPGTRELFGVNHRIDLFNDYEKAMREKNFEEKDYYNASSFKVLWRRIFPYMRCRTSNAVTGKCNECEETRWLARVCKKSDRKAALALVLHHKLLIRAIKKNCHDREELACKEPQKYVPHLLTRLSARFFGVARYPHTHIHSPPFFLFHQLLLLDD